MQHSVLNNLLTGKFVLFFLTPHFIERATSIYCRKLPSNVKELQLVTSAGP